MKIGKRKENNEKNRILFIKYMLFYCRNRVNNIAYNRTEEQNGMHRTEKKENN